eukprot:9467715-Pyramimonas_sp.AAC.2
MATRGRPMRPREKPLALSRALLEPNGAQKITSCDLQRAPRRGNPTEGLIGRVRITASGHTPPPPPPPPPVSYTHLRAHETGAYL